MQRDRTHQDRVETYSCPWNDDTSHPHPCPCCLSFLRRGLDTPDRKTEAHAPIFCHSLHSHPRCPYHHWNKTQRGCTRQASCTQAYPNRTTPPSRGRTRCTERQAPCISAAPKSRTKGGSRPCPSQYVGQIRGKHGWPDTASSLCARGVC